MFVQIGKDKRLDLIDPKDFKKFKIAVQLSKSDFEAAKGSFANTVTFDSSDHGWVSIAALRGWDGLTADQDWQDGLTQMIKVAEKYGWVDAQKQAIRAHIEWS